VRERERERERECGSKSYYLFKANKSKLARIVT